MVGGPETAVVMFGRVCGGLNKLANRGVQFGCSITTHEHKE
jgi:hypothetical protein